MILKHQFIRARHIVIFNFYKIKRRVNENLFMDFKVIGGFIFILSLLITFYYPNTTFITIPSKQNIESTLDNFLKATTVFIGIIISLLILSFQNFNKNFGRYAFIGFLKLRSVKILFTLYIINILFSIYSLSYVREIQEIDTYGKIIFVISILINVLLIFLLFPISFQLLRKSQSRYNVQSILTLINDKWIYTYQFYSRNGIPSIEIIDNDPLNILKETCLISIKNDDFITYELLLESLYEHLKEIVKKHEYKNISLNCYFYFEFSEFLKSISLNVINTNSYENLNKLLRLRIRLEMYLLNHRIKLTQWESDFFKYESHYFTFDIENYFDKAVINKNDELADRVIHIYYEYCNEIITKYLPDNFKIFDPKEYQKTGKVQSMCILLLSTNLKRITDLAVKNKQTGLFSRLFNYFSLDGVIISSKNDITVKLFLLNILRDSKEYVLNKYINTGITEIESQHFPYFSLYINEEIDNLQHKTIYNGMKRSIRLLFSKKLLENHIINLLKTIALHFVENFSKITSYKELLLDVISEFEYLKNLVNDNSDNYQKDAYIRLNRYLGYIQSWIHKDIVDTEIKLRIDNAMNDFTNLQKYKKELESIGYITNDNLI